MDRTNFQVTWFPCADCEKFERCPDYLKEHFRFNPDPPEGKRLVEYMQEVWMTNCWRQHNRGCFCCSEFKKCSEIYSIIKKKLLETPKRLVVTCHGIDKQGAADLLWHNVRKYMGPQMVTKEEIRGTCKP